MTDTKHAPGPWFLVPYGDGQDTVVCMDEAGNMRIAFMATPSSRDKQGLRKVKANARLIAAAPELLEALDWALAEIEGRTRYATNGIYTAEEQRANAMELAQAAIAKAKGVA